MIEHPPVLRLNRIAAPVDNLGYGRRIVIWVQGCTIGCFGCIARHTWNRKGGEAISVAELAELIVRLEQPHGALDGLTISGGEPTEQPESVFALVRALRQSRWLGETRDVLLYSGLALANLQHRFGSTLSSIDAVVAGPYDDEIPGDGLVGSANQQLFTPTRIGEARYMDMIWPQRSLEGASDGTTLLLSGIQARGEHQEFVARLRDHGLAMR